MTRRLFDHFVSALGSLDKQKMLQISMDGPNGNWAFYSEINHFRDENGMSRLLPTRSCGLSTSNASLKAGKNSTDWGAKNLLKVLHQPLHDTPARQADFIEVTGSNQFPLLFCEFVGLKMKKWQTE